MGKTHIHERSQLCSKFFFTLDLSRGGRRTRLGAGALREMADSPAPVLFVHVPKTGGTSVTNMLKKAGVPLLDKAATLAHATHCSAHGRAKDKWRHSVQHVGVCARRKLARLL